MMHIQYSTNMKMADVIHTNYNNLLVINRFGISLGFADKTVSEVCTKYGINTELFIFICSAFSNHEMEPTEYQINNFPVDQVVNFLKASHLFYRQVRLPEIKESLYMLSATCSPMHGKALEKFFSEYNEEIEKHLSYEDKIVFPYIESLSNKEIEDAFTIRQFEEHHDDVEEKLEDLKNIIIKYIPEGVNNEPRRLLLEKLFNFEEDLNRHILIENKLLVPIVTKLENNLR